MRAHLRTDVRYDMNFLRPPFVFEFGGPPSSGKSTNIKKLDDRLRGEGFRVLTVQEGAEAIRHIPRTTPLYNIRTGLDALVRLIDVVSGHQYDVVIFDRCIFDPDNWMAYWEDKNQLSPAERIMIADFFRLRFWVDHIVGAYILTCDPAVALERERKVTTRKSDGQYTNLATIAKLKERYEFMCARLCPLFPQLELIDTTHHSAQTMTELITGKALAAIDRHMNKVSVPQNG